MEAGLAIIGILLLFFLIERCWLKAKFCKAKVVGKYEGINRNNEPVFRVTGRDEHGIEVSYGVTQDKLQKMALGDDIDIAYTISRCFWNVNPALPLKNLP